MQKSPASTPETNSGTASNNSIFNMTEDVKYQSRISELDNAYLKAVKKQLRLDINMKTEMRLLK